MDQPLSRTPASSPLPRRDFLKTTGTAAAIASAAGLAAPAPARAYGANDKLRIGFIGPGGRGFGAHVKTLAKLFHETAKIAMPDV